MRFSITTAVTAALAFTSDSLALNILLGNDDGFAAANVRETYRLLKAEGHNVVLVASADNQSGMGGRAVFTNNASLVQNSEYNIIPAGSPSIGRDPMDSNIWYYNGTPAACAFVGMYQSSWHDQYILTLDRPRLCDSKLHELLRTRSGRRWSQLRHELGSFLVHSQRYSRLHLLFRRPWIPSHRLLGRKL